MRIPKIILLFALSIPITLVQVMEAKIVKRWEHLLRTPIGDPMTQLSESVVDDSGNVYTCGYGQGNGNYINYYTFKYNASGKLIWRNEYNNNLRNDIDRATAIAIDDSANIYVTGNSMGFGLDAATIKYSSNGNELWVSRFATNSDEYPLDIFVDKQGNSYVTGYTYSGIPQVDIFVVKYDKLGNKLWSDVYAHAAKNARASSICVDDSGNVYIGGYTQVYGMGPTSFIIVKYNSAGQRQWIQEPSSTLLSTDVLGKMIISIGKGATIYITGRGVKYTQGNTIDDIILLKLNTISGNIIWSQFYDYIGKIDYPSDLIIDKNENIYICGTVTNSLNYTDYVTLKFTSSGLLSWAKTYDGLMKESDNAISCCLDKDQNVYVSGSARNPNTWYDCITIKYDSTGTKIWDLNYNDSNNGDNYVLDLNVDTLGNIFLTGPNSIVMYGDSATSFTTPDFIRSCINQPLSVIGFDVEVDSNGFYYVVGQTQVSPAWAHVAKFAPNMDTVWTRRYTSGVQHDWATSVDLDDYGNVYVGLISDFNELTIVKYSPTGSLLWKNSYSNGDASVNKVFVKVGSDNNIYFVRSNWSQSLGTYPLITEKYSPSGIVLWSKNYYLSTGSGSSHFPNAITMDNSNNIYIVGTTNALADDDMITLKYDATGNLSWSKVYSESSGSNEKGVDVDVDLSNNVYVTGNTTKNGQDNFVVIKYKGGGSQQWVYKYDGIQNSYDYAVGIQVSNSVYIAGNTYGQFTFSGYVALKLDTSGVFIWEKQYDTNGGMANDVKLDQNNNFYIVGGISQGNQDNYFIIKYDQLGKMLWNDIYGPNIYGGVINAIAVDKNSIAYVTGSKYEYNCYTLKYEGKTLTDVSEIQKKDVDQFKVYPNPTNQEFIIYNHQGDNYHLTIYNFLGEEVYSISVSNQYQNVNLYSHTDGIYFLRMETKRGVINKKIIINK